MKRLLTLSLTFILLLTSTPAAQASARRKDYQRTSADPENLELKPNPSSVERPPSGTPQFGQYAFRDVVFTGPTSLWTFTTGYHVPSTGKIAVLTRKGGTSTYATTISITIAPIPWEYDARQIDAYFTRAATIDHERNGDLSGDWFLPGYASAGEPSDATLLGLPARRYVYTTEQQKRICRALYASKGRSIYSVTISSTPKAFELDEPVFEEIVRTLAFKESNRTPSSSRSSSSTSSIIVPHVTEEEASSASTLLNRLQEQTHTYQINPTMKKVGITLLQDGEQIFIATVIAGSALRQGIRSHDELIAVNDHPVRNVPLQEVSALLLGKKGSTVTLRLRRKGQVFSATVLRDATPVSIVEEFTTKDVDGITIMALRQFGKWTEQNFQSEMTKKRLSLSRGLILDLRNNGGGFMDSTMVVLSTFLPRNTSVARCESASMHEEWNTKNNPVIPLDVPLVVIVNSGTMGAAEIAAHALQQSRHAILIGETTFGFGKVVQIEEFSNGRKKIEAVCELMTPDRHLLTEMPVVPDIAVRSRDPNNDAMLEKALNVLRRQ